jgi:phosphatidylglycerophosphatase A
MKKMAEVVATAFYVGYAPIVPATFGAALGAIVYWFVMPQSVATETLVTLAVIFLAIVTSGKAEEKYGKDGRRIVIDEVAGMFVSLCFLVPRGTSKSFLVFLAAFVVFRVFDILKPFPANRLQKLPGGWGVVADDVFAGIYTNVLIRIWLATRGM